MRHLLWMTMLVTGCDLEPGNRDRTVGEEARDDRRDVRTENPAFDQKEQQPDVRITANVRQGILAHEDLSMRADNVQITTRNGHVRLRGKVKSQAERTAVERIARETDGVVSVSNELEVDAAS